MIAMAVIQMAEIAGIIWVFEIHKRSGPFTYRISSSASTAMLNRGVESPARPQDCHKDNSAPYIPAGS